MKIIEKYKTSDLPVFYFDLRTSTGEKYLKIHKAEHRIEDRGRMVMGSSKGRENILQEKIRTL